MTTWRIRVKITWESCAIVETVIMSPCARRTPMWSIQPWFDKVSASCAHAAALKRNILRRSLAGVSEDGLAPMVFTKYPTMSSSISPIDTEYTLRALLRPARSSPIDAQLHAAPQRSGRYGRIEAMCSRANPSPSTMPTVVTQKIIEIKAFLRYPLQ